MICFSILLDPSAQRDFKKIKRLNLVLFHRLIRIVDSLGQNPYQGKALHGNKKGCLSLRDGDYRIIYEVHSLEKVVHIITVGHRREIYR